MYLYLHAYKISKHGCYRLMSKKEMKTMVGL